jgi:hypothetical protein
VLELRADVIALRGQFMLPPDDARLRIIETDAVSYIRQHPGCADVLLLDGYDETGLPPAAGQRTLLCGLPARPAARRRAGRQPVQLRRALPPPCWNA